MSAGEEGEGLSLRPSLFSLQGVVERGSGAGRGEVEYFDGIFKSGVYSGGMVRWEEVERGRRMVSLWGEVECGAMWRSR